MFIVTLLALGFIGVVFGTPMKRSDTVFVHLSGPSYVSSVDDLKFTATVTNVGTDAVRIFKYGTALDDKLPTKSFAVTKNGITVPFLGIKLSVSLAKAGDSAYTTIPAGASVSVNHELASRFDFASAGAGVFTFKPITKFHFVSVEKNSTSTIKFSRIQASTSSVTVVLSGDIFKRELPSLNKRAVDICKDASRRSFIDASYTEGKYLASLGSSYISSNGASDSLYRAYFGSTSTSRVTSILNAVAKEKSRSRTLSCVDTFGGCEDGVIAYTMTDTTNIYFCNIFFDEGPSTDLCSGSSVEMRKIRGGTTLHELTHAVGGTDDYSYGCSEDQSLSATEIFLNADNYNCFTTEVYASSSC